MPHQIFRLVVLSFSVVAIAACDGLTIAPIQRAVVDTGAAADTDGSGDTDTVDAGADTAADTAVDTEADTAADTAADTEADTSADTTADTSADTEADTAADTTADTAADTATDSGGSGDTGTVTDGCPTGFVRIEPGTFTMGSPTGESGRETDETQHSVTLTRAFCMEATEVTQGAWLAEMGSNPALFQDCGLDCPVEQVSWSDVVYYANVLSQREGLAECYVGSTFAGLDCTGYRLPTEAEWEYAARAGSTAATYGPLDSVGWYEGNSGATTHAVGGKTPNPFGLYDMLGNVREWTGDWYGPYPVTATDPTGTAAGTYRSFRGGSWFHFADIARAANRLGGTADFRVDNIGFRLVKTAL